MTGRRPGASGEAAHLRPSENQRRSLQSSAATKRFQPRCLELSRPGGALPGQGDLRHLAPVWRQGLWHCCFHGIPFEEPRVGHRPAVKVVRCKRHLSLHFPPRGSVLQVHTAQLSFTDPRQTSQSCRTGRRRERTQSRHSDGNPAQQGGEHL